MRTWTRFDTVAVTGLTTLGLVIRVGYVASMRWSPSDPWRHLVLLRNLREGAGFTPFIGEPYVWYQPPWHWLCAALWPIDPAWIATVFSLACVPALYLWLRDEGPGERSNGETARVAAVAGATLMAAYGPVVRFTCQYGSEAFAMALILGALLLVLRREGYPSAIVAGLTVGLALLCRLNFAFAAPLFLPAFRRPGRAMAVLAGAAIPLALGWIRNARLLATRDWVFTWDGLATPTDGFTPLSTFLIQGHPDVAEGLRRVHALIFTHGPEWVSVPTVAAFMLIGAVSLAFSRRPWPALAAFSMLVYMALLESTGSSNFLRIWLGVFPAIFAGIGFAAARLWRLAGWGRWVSAIGLALTLSLGLPFLAPPRGASATLLGMASVPLEQVIPGRAFLIEDLYLVNSGFFHPESLIYAFPEKRFLGLPLEPDRFDAFQAAYPEYRHILWHRISIQDELLNALVDSGRYRVVRETTNAYGYGYTVLESTQ